MIHNLSDHTFLRNPSLLFHIVKTKIQTRYQGNSLGVLWTILRPAGHLLVLGAVVSQIAKVDMDKYLLHLFSGLIPWQFFQVGYENGARSFIEYRHIALKVPINLALFNFVNVAVELVNLIASLLFLSIIYFAVGGTLSWSLICLPYLLLIFAVFTLGLTFFGSVLTSYFRDLEHITAMFFQLLYFLTPILYPFDLIKDSTIGTVVLLNPISHFIMCFQAVLVDGAFPDTKMLLNLTAASSLIYLTGFVFLSISSNKMLRS